MRIQFLDDLPPLADRGPEIAEGQRKFAAALRKHPGKWAAWPSDLPAYPGLVSAIRQGYAAPFRSGFDAATRNGEVYVRFLGEGQTPPPQRPGGRHPMYSDFAASLRAKPLSWESWPGSIGSGTARTYLHAIPAGRLRAFAKGKYEAKLGGSGLLVRFVGGAQ